MFVLGIRKTTPKRPYSWFRKKKNYSKMTLCLFQEKKYSKMTLCLYQEKGETTPKKPILVSGKMRPTTHDPMYVLGKRGTYSKITLYFSKGGTTQTKGTYSKKTLCFSKGGTTQTKGNLLQKTLCFRKGGMTQTKGTYS